MSRGRLIQNSFISGIWSPMLEGRSDLEKYPDALYLLENFVLWPHGPAQVRPGTRFINAAKNAAKNCILVRFKFSASQVYVLEFGDEYIRFYRDQGVILDGASAYEIVSPYDHTDIENLKFTQRGDVIYIFHQSYATRELSRTGDTAWTIAAVDWDVGAIGEIGNLPSSTLTLSATTGDRVEFTAGGGTFTDSDVGRTITSGGGEAIITAFTSYTLVWCEIVRDFASTDPIAAGDWKINGRPNVALTLAATGPIDSVIRATASGTSLTRDYRLVVAENSWTVSAGGTDEYYLKTTASTYTSVKPGAVHLNDVLVVEGTLGSLAVNSWGFGNNDALAGNTIYARLSDGTDPDTKLPDIGYITSEKEGAITSFAPPVGSYMRANSGLLRVTGYIFGLPLVVNAQVSREPSSVDVVAGWTLEAELWNATNGYPSCGAFFENRLVVAGSTAYPRTIWGSASGDYENFGLGINDADSYQYSLGGNTQDAIEWLLSDDYLLAGTAGAVYRVGSENTSVPITPTNVIAKPQGVLGAASIQPVPTGATVLYAQTHGKKLRELVWSWEQEKMIAPDMLQLAEHIGRRGIRAMAFQAEPFPTVWVCFDDGSLAAMTYLREEGVTAWHDHPIDGLVESLTVIPGDGYDELWMVVNRTINGSTVRYVEMMEALFLDDAATYTANKGLNAFFVDCGLTYNGAEASTITGLEHLNGETVAVLADGSPETTKVVSGGSITLDNDSSVVHVGLPITAKLQPMRLDTYLQDGTAQGRTRRVVDVVARVHASGPFKGGRDTDNLDVLIDTETPQTFGAGYPLFTGDIYGWYEGEFDRISRPLIVQDKPMPLTVVCLVFEVET